MWDVGLGRPGRVLCLGAHSDDIEIGCGGAVLALRERSPQTVFRWVVFSGTAPRADEARRAAAAFLGPAGEVSVLGFRDGYFPAQFDRIKDEFEGLKGFAPDAVFTHFREDRHQDHRVISDLTWNTFRDHLVLEYEIPKYDGDLGKPNVFVPLTEAQVAAKVRGLMECFGSQRSRQWFDEETFRAVLRLRGLEANSPTRYAEAFHGRKVVLG